MKRLLPFAWAALALLSGISKTRAGDNVANATVLSGATATSTENNQNATVETGENAAMYRSIWWKWTAPATGRVTLDTTGSDAFNKYLNVWVPSSSASAFSLATNSARVRDAGGYSINIPTTTFPVIAGTTYYIRAASYSSSQYGNISLTLSLNSNTDINQLNLQGLAIASNDFFANRAQLTGYSPSAIAYNSTASREALEPADGYCSIWWTWTAPENGRLTISTTGSSAINKYLRVFTGSSLQTLRYADYEGGYSYNEPTSVIPVFKGTVYTICALNYSITTFQEGDVVLTLNLNTASDINNLNVTSLGTTNDLFANRVQLTGATPSSIAYSLDGTRESNEPSGAGYATLWWTWTASASGPVTISTTGSDNINKILSVWTGSTLATLQPAGSAGGYSYSTPTLSFTASAGQTYQISVGAYSSSANLDTVLLTLSGPGGAPAITVPTLAIYNAVQLEWLAEKGVTYQLQTSTDNVTWTNSGSAIVGDGATHQIPERIDRNHAFFRVSRQ